MAIISRRTLIMLVTFGVVLLSAFMTFSSDVKADGFSQHARSGPATGPDWRPARVQSIYMVPKSGYAIDGYDTVAYFTDGKPRKGREDISYEWGEATWLFASEEHRTAFINDPESYAPQYGGWCAFGMHGAYGAQTRPQDSWNIYNGKLYLNYNKFAQKMWNARRDEAIAVADEVWPQVSQDIRAGRVDVHWQEKK